MPIFLCLNTKAINDDEMPENILSVIHLHKISLYGTEHIDWRQVEMVKLPPYKPRAVASKIAPAAKQAARPAQMPKQASHLAVPQRIHVDETSEEEILSDEFEDCLSD